MHHDTEREKQKEEMIELLIPVWIGIGIILLSIIIIGVDKFA